MGATSKRRVCQTLETLQVQACYAMGYNLAIEYMADYEKTWMLAAFRDLNKRVLAPNGRALTEWLFLEVPPSARSVLWARGALADADALGCAGQPAHPSFMCTRRSCRATPEQ